jgi:hypothetical protein
MSFSRFLPLLLAATLAACASGGSSSSAIVSPNSLDEAIAQVQGQATALEQSAALALQQGLIDVPTAAAALKIGDQLTAAVSQARQLEAAGNIAGANTALATATTLAVQLATYLNQHGVHK